MKRKYIPLFALVFALVLGMNIAPASAYFTDTHTANGGVPIEIGPDADIYEWVKDKTKHVVITVDEDSVPVFIRVQSEYPTTMLDESVEFNSSDWKYQDGWYVYQHAVNGGGKTSELQFTYYFDKIQTTTNRPPEDGNNYNVVINYEYVPANIDPLPDYASWAQGLRANA